MALSAKTYGSAFAVWALAAGMLALNSCSKTPSGGIENDSPGGASIAIPAGLEAGSNEMLRANITAAPELEVLVSDVIIPPGAEVPRHYHPGEEFVYVIEGSAVHVEEGKADREIGAGDSMVIAPEAIHAPRGGPNGARAIVFRVHLEGQPERIPVPDPEGSAEE